MPSAGVPSAGAQVMSSILNTILQAKETTEERSSAYLKLTEQLRNNDETALSHVSKHCASFVKTVLGDIDEKDLVHNALAAFGICLREEEFTRHLTASDLKKVIDSLCEIVKECKDKTVCTRALFCLPVKSIKPAVLKSHIPKIVEVVHHIVLSGNVKSPILEHESVNTIIRLLKHCPEEMEAETVKWAKVICPMVVNTVVKVREKGFIAMKLGLPIMLKNKQHLDAISKHLMDDLKVLLIAEMEELMKKQLEIPVLEAWTLYAQLLGQYLHGGSFLNQMLPIVESGFKASTSEARIASYRAWKTLIDSFALKRAIIQDAKRIKLIMQVFRVTSVKDERVAVEKLRVWWHYVLTLKPTTPAVFEQVVIPLLNYCRGLGKSSRTPGKTPVLQRNAAGGFTSPSTPNSSLSSQSVFRSVQLKGVEVLGLLLQAEINPSHLPSKFTVAKPDRSLVDSQIFTKHGGAIVTAARELLLNVGNEVQEGVLYHLWISLASHIKDMLEPSGRKENVEIFTSFLLVLPELVTTEALQAQKVLKLVEALTCLPCKVLSSSVYNVGSLTSTAVMKGCPALSLVELLFQEKILNLCIDEERFFVVLEKLVEHGVSSPVAALGFLQACIEHTESKTTLPVDVSWRLWSIVVNPLMEHIMKTNEVNQGDALGHNFTCLYKALEFPLLRLLPSDLHQASMKSMMKTWQELYMTFSRLSAMVPNAEANICCEELCERIQASHGSLDTLLLSQGGSGVEHMAAVCRIMVDTLDFSSLTQPNILSPAKFTKKHKKALGNLTAFVKLVASCTKALHSIVTSRAGPFEIQRNTETVPNMVSPANDLTHVLDQLFNHLPTADMIKAALEKLAEPVAQFFIGAAKRSSKLYTQQFLQKLEKLWLDLSTSVQARYKGPFDSDFLKVLTPLLAATFLHPRRAIKNQTLLLWNATFAQAHPLEYADELQPVLSKLREKTPIVLPGWSGTDVSTIEDTPVSQMSMGGESSAPKPHIIGLPSPHKNHGSFFNKVVSPTIKKSPLLSRKSPKSPATISPAASVKRRIALPPVDDMNSSDFVEIRSSPRKQMVLTEHQKEKMREQRGTVPALYSSVDNSMDVSLMGQFTCSDTPTSTPTPTPVSFAPFKFPTSTRGSIEPKKPAEAEEKPVSKPEKRPLRKRRSDEKSSEGDEVSESKPPMTRRRSSRKSVQFANESQDSNKSEELEVPTKDKLSSEEPMETASDLGSADLITQPQGQEVDVFGFMTPSGDSVKTKPQSTAESESEKVNEEGDHKAQAVPTDRKDAKKVDSDIEMETEKEDISFSEPDVTEVISQTEDLSPEKGNASDLKSFVLSEQDSDGLSDDEGDRDEKKKDGETPEEEKKRKGGEKKNKTVDEKLWDSDVVKGRRTRRAVTPSPPPEKSSRRNKTSIKNQDNQEKRAEKTGKRSKETRVPIRRSASVDSEEPSAKPQSQTAILAEDSQQYSPGKLKSSLATGAIVEESQPCSPSLRSSSVDETPVKLDFQGAFAFESTTADSSKSAFTQDGISTVPDTEMSQPELPNQAPDMSTPQKRPPQRSPVSPMSPIVKLKKLSEEDITRLSPTKQAPIDSFTVPEPVQQKSVGRGAKRRISLLKSTKAAAEEAKSSPRGQTTVSPLNMDDVIHSSQDGPSFAVNPSLAVAETQFTPQMFQSKAKAPSPAEESVNINNDSCVAKDVSDTEITVIKKVKPGRVSPRTGSNRKETHSDSDIATKDISEQSEIDSSKLSTPNSSGYLGNPDILPADIEASQGSQNDSEATITGGRVKRRKSKKMLDELKGPSQLPESEGSEPSQGSQPKRRGRPRKKVFTPTQDDESVVAESADGQTPDDNESSVLNSTAGGDSKDEATEEKILKAKLAGSTLAGIASSQEFDPESKTEETKAVGSKADDEDDSVVETTQTNENDVTDAETQDCRVKTRQNVKEAEAYDRKEDESVEQDQSEELEKPDNRSLRSRSRRTETRDMDNSEKVPKENTVEDIDDSDEDMPLTEVKSQLTTGTEETTKCSEGSKIDKEEDSPLVLCLSKSQSSVASTNSLELKRDKENAAEEEMEIDTKAPPESCVDMFTDTPAMPEQEAQKDESVESESGEPTEISESDLSQKAETKTREIKRLDIDMKFDKVKFVRSKGRFSLDSKRRKSPVQSPKNLPGNKRRSLALKGRRSRSPRVAISPLSKANKALVKKQLSQASRDSEEHEADGAENKNPMEENGEDATKVVVVEMNEKTADKEESGKLMEEKKKQSTANTEVQLGTMQNLNKGVSRSPPKKGAPFEPPQTPTSASKYASRSQYILERSRRICLAKESPSPLSGRKQWTPRKSPKGILKHSPRVRSPDKSPQASCMRPVHGESPPTFRPIIPKIYSPSASPSAGILKKRRLSGDTPTESPSPPNKQRRVCFDDSRDVCHFTSESDCSPSKPINRCLELGTKTIIASPLVSSTPSKTQGTGSNSKFITTPSKSLPQTKDQDGFAVPNVVSVKRGTEKQDLTENEEDSCVSTQGISQINCSDPVCPELLQCDASVEEVLPQLTSSTWKQGLVNLVRARDIHTVGQLSALSEYDINTLPIKPPKIATAKAALTSFAQLWSVKQGKAGKAAHPIGSIADADTGDDTASPEKQALPSADEVLDVSPVKVPDFDSSINSDQEEERLSLFSRGTDRNTAAAGLVNTCQDTDSANAESTLQKDDDSAENTASARGLFLNSEARPAPKSPTRKKLLQDVKDIKVRMTIGLLTRLRSDQLVGLHQDLNEMMTSVVTALRSKCAASPKSSQSDSD